MQTSSARFDPTTNMVAIKSGHSNFSGASKIEYPNWLRSLRVLLNSLRCLDTDSGDKVRASLGNPPLPENFGKPRGKVTEDLLDSVQGSSLRAAGFQLGDTLISGSDRREWIRAKELRDKERNTVVSSILLLARLDSPLYLVLLEDSRRSKDPNTLIEAAKTLFNITMGI